MSQETQSIKFPPHRRYTDDKTPITEWTIADTLESRHDQTWMLLSENQCQSIANQLEHCRRRADNTLERLHRELAEQIVNTLDDIAHGRATISQTISDMPATQTNQRQTGAEAPATRERCFSLWWSDILQTFDEPDVTETDQFINRLDDQDAEDIQELILRMTNQSPIQTLYREWADSLPADALMPYPNLMAPK